MLDIIIERYIYGKLSEIYFTITVLGTCSSVPEPELV